MKKLFTLLVGALFAGSAFAQKTWTNVVVNGDFEGTVPAYEVLATADDVASDGTKYSKDYDFTSLTAETWNSFWVHEWTSDQTKQSRGTANIVEDPADPTNHCAKVVIRSRAEGEAAGNLTPDYTKAEGTYGSWDCQFFIYATAPIPAGKEVRLQLKVKAERDGSFETQNHSLPGTYIDANAFGNPKYTTEWKEYKSSVITSTEDQASKGYQCIAFNLCTDEEANVIYFDDIKLQIRDPKEEESGDAGAWINFMRKGIYSDDIIKGIGINNNQEVPFECTNFTIQIPNGTGGTDLVKAPVEEVPGEPGVMAVHVPVRGYKVESVEDLDADGNQQIDEEGKVKMKSIYLWNNGDTIGTSAPQRWSCQFFVSTLHKMVPKEKYRFKFRCKADKPTQLGTQCHYGPSQYAHYNTFGSESDFPISTDWTTFELGDYENGKVKTIPGIPALKPSDNYPGEIIGCQTITFDCVPLEGEDNNFYLIVDEFSFTEKNVKTEDRTLGTPEDLKLPINEGEEEQATQIDLSQMLATFELEDISFLQKPKANDGMKLFMMEAIDPDDPEEGEKEVSSGYLSWSDGGFVGANGQYIEDDMGVQLFFDEDSYDADKKTIDVKVWNNPDSGISFADGKTVQTKFALANAGWYYVYNVTLGTAETLAGITPVKAVKVDNGYIYNLSGQRVDASYKGLVIKNGQKLIQK